MNNYYVNHNIGGVVGGSNNTVNNIFQTEQSIFDNAGIDDVGLKQSHYDLLSMELFLKYGDSLSEEVDRGLREGIFPLKIRITDLFSDCANGTYYNGGNRDSEIARLINSVFTLIYTLRGYYYKAK